jgi:hypothetical protein
MFRTIKIIGTVLAAAMAVVPVASAGGPRTPAEDNSLGVLSEYQQKVSTDATLSAQRPSPALRDYRQGVGFNFKAPSYWNAAPSYWSTAQSAGAPITPPVAVNHSLGVPPEYLGTGTSTQGPAYSLGPALLQYRQGVGFFAKPRRSAQGPAYSLGPALLDYQQSVGFYAKATPTARGNGFDWSSAGIGAAIVAGLFLMIAGIGAMTIRARHDHRAERLSAT